MDVKNEIIQTISATVFIVSVVISATLLLLYSVFDKTPLIYKNLPFPVINKMIHPGDIIPFRFERCNKSSRPTRYVATRYLLSVDNKTSIVMGSVEKILDPGCKTEVSEVNTLPKDIKPGWYVLSGTSEVQSSIRPKIVEWTTEPFEVTLKKTPK